MLYWKITSTELVSDVGKLTWEGFEYLSGKKINWVKRIGKNIISIKDRGHVRLYDEHFIKGEIYKHRSGKYRCSYVANDGEALLNICNNKMIIKYSKSPFKDSWEVT